MNTTPVKSIQFSDSDNQRYKGSAVYLMHSSFDWPQRTKPTDYIRESLNRFVKLRRGVRSAYNYKIGEQKQFNFSQITMSLQRVEAKLSYLSDLENELITKKIRGSFSRLDEVRLDSIQKQIDDLIGVQSPTAAEQELLNRFNQLLDQSAELLGKLEARIQDPEET